MSTIMEQYYRILGVTKAATIEQIKSAFKRLALQFHPDKNNSPDASDQFLLVKEACDYLLKYHQPLNAWSSVHSPREHHCDAHRHREFRGKHRVPMIQRLPSTTHHVLISLEEILRNKRKKYIVPRMVIDADGHKKAQSIPLLVRIAHPGLLGMRITFPYHGDSKPGYINGDIVLIVKPAPHAHFKIINDADLLYEPLVTYELLASNFFQLSIPTLEDDTFLVAIEKVSTELKIPNRGLPRDLSKRRGDIIVRPIWKNVALPGSNDADSVFTI